MSSQTSGGVPPLSMISPRATLDAVDQEMRGLLHLASPPTTTWFGLAREACKIAGIDTDRVRPSSTDDLVRPARRPRRSVLKSERDIAMLEWSPGLLRWLTAG